MLSTTFDPAQHQISHLHLLEQDFLTSSSGINNPLSVPELRSHLAKNSNGLVFPPSVLQSAPAQPHLHQHGLPDTVDIQSLPSLMSPDPSVRDRSESIDGREEEDEDEEMDEYEIFALPTQYRGSSVTKPMTPLQLLNSSRPKVLASGYSVEQPQLYSQYQSSQQCRPHNTAVPAAGFHTLYPQLQFEHQLQQPACVLPVYQQHNGGQFLSQDMQFQLLQQQHTSPHSSTHPSTIHNNTLTFSSQPFSSQTQPCSEAYSTQLLNGLELGVQQPDMAARPTPQNTIPSLEQDLDMLMIPQFGGSLSYNDLLMTSSASTLVQSPSLSWASITPSRDSSPNLSSEHVALAGNSRKRTTARPSKKRSGSTYSRHGCKVSKTKTVSLPVASAASTSDPSTAEAESTAGPFESVEGTDPSVRNQSPATAEVPVKRRRRMRQLRIKVKPTSFACDAAGCGKIFSRAYNLTSHMKTHSEERPFVCGSCPLAFARRHDRERHVRLHTGEKPYTCESCGCGFMRNDALHRHQRICGQSASALLALLQRQQQRPENATGYEDLFAHEG
ncbi:hypothetical protein EC968_006385 [Mortierella alpina]|nr:hypothetical protein EC968_006385 [Mortierella alpina]